MYHLFFMHSSVDGHLGCSQFQAILNRAAVDTNELVSLVVGHRILWLCTQGCIARPFSFFEMHLLWVAMAVLKLDVNQAVLKCTEIYRVPPESRNSRFTPLCLGCITGSWGRTTYFWFLEVLRNCHIDFLSGSISLYLVSLNKWSPFPESLRAELPFVLLIVTLWLR